MALSPHRKEKRDEKIKQRFLIISDKKTPNGKRLYTYEAIIEQLADEFCLSERWIKEIVFNK